MVPTNTTGAEPMAWPMGAAKPAHEARTAGVDPPTHQPPRSIDRQGLENALTTVRRAFRVEGSLSP